MSRLAIACVLALAATTADAQEAPSGQSHAPAAPSTNGVQPPIGPKGTQSFLFDGRMKGDGVRQGAQVDNRHPNAGAIIVQPKPGQPERE
ncbi:hypothetical protein DES45_101802 [Microvirga subterranea]|uniref:Uncharacterized protein n=1 Tax=Microvirga subterranea TaxID=186651 RepID=A0A370HVK8_9HYPH|nr:hypothetical protein DES45_101802 [Microvirga subterranea]